MSDQFQFVNNKIKISRKLGGGSYGAVFEAKKRDSTNRGYPLAVKFTVSKARVQNVDGNQHYEYYNNAWTGSTGLSNTVFAELGVVDRLGPHPNIMQPEEAFFDPETHTMALVMSKATSDLEHLNTSLETNEAFQLSGSSLVVARLQIAAGVTNGLAQMHLNNMVHLDLKPGNIVVFLSAGNSFIEEIYEFVPRISDFGMSERLEGRRLQKAEVGTFAFRAPELYCGFNRYSTAVDIWSLGLVLLELFFGPQYNPFRGLKSHQDYFSIIKQIFGEPSARWFTKYSTNDQKCTRGSQKALMMLGGTATASDRNTDEMQMQCIRKMLFLDQKYERHCVGLYGKDRLDHMLTIVGMCLYVDPSKRPTAGTVMYLLGQQDNLHVFKTGSTPKRDASDTTFEDYRASLLGLLAPSDLSVLLAYSQRLHHRLTGALDDNIDVHYKSACVTSSAKILNYDDQTLQEIYGTICKDREQTMLAEIGLIQALGFHIG